MRAMKSGRDSEESDTLICGFGPRGGRRDSAYSAATAESTGEILDGLDGLNPNFAPGNCEGNGGPSPGPVGAGDVGGRDGEKDMKSSLICGFGFADDKSYGSDASGDVLGAMGKLLGDDDDAPQDVKEALLAMGSSAGVPAENGEIVSTERGEDVYMVSIPTKTSDDEKDTSKPKGRGIPRMDSSKSMSSDGDESILSEDAVVLMVSMLEESEWEGGEKDKGKKKKSREEEVCGRVFKRQSLTDYESIPTELEIDNSALDQSLTPASGNLDPGKMGNNASTAKDRDSRRGLSEVPLKEGTKSQTNPSDAYAGIYKPKPNLKASKPINNGAEYVEGGEGGSAETTTSEGGSAPGKQPAVSFATGFDQDQTHRRRSSGAEYQNTLEYLDVIQEDGDDDSSTAVGAVSKASVASHASDSKASDADEASSSAASRSGGRSYDSTSSLPKLMGEHARSMAKQLSARVLDVGGKEAQPTKERTAPKRSIARTASSKRRLKEEGRLAIVSRNKETEYVKVIVPKPESVKTLIHDAISKNILFKACSSEELDELIEVFAPSEASAGSTVIRQGDEGDAFYVMERGTIDVYEEETHKATLYAGTSFGEIALLYGCPRSATLRTRYSCKLWGISRTAFRAITSQFKERRMEAKVNFLRKVKIKDKTFNDVLSESELNTLALATINESYEAGQFIVREGEPGDIFYMIDSGSVDVFIKAKGDTPVVTLTGGQSFGELALLSNDVRTASCVAKTDVQCHILMRKDFNLLLGDLQSLMDGGDYRKREAKFVPPTKKASTKSFKVNLSDLEVLKVLGIGAFGRVRLAKLKRPINGLKNDGFFALKCISKQSLKDNGLDSHIMNEKAIMSDLDHPFINRYYCDMEDKKYLYFLLEALPGGELCKRLREEKQFPEAWAMFYSASVLFAFCHMHAKKIAYRDLKPENLVMDKIGYVKVVDFGLAKVIDGGKTWTLCGTPAYLAPEIVLNDGHDWAVDYWALGVFLFEMTSGKEPFAAKNPMEVYKQIVSGHVDIPGYFSPNLEDLILKLLNISKSKRLGRTMGGGGAVMQHRWYSDFDWDAYLEKRLDVPLQPKTNETLSEDSVTSESRDSSLPLANGRGSKSTKPHGNDSRAKPPRMTYSLGQGNRHHQKLLEMMDNSCGDNNESEQQVDNVRMTMMRVIKQHERWSKTSHESSTNSSARNTSLGIGPKFPTRGSQATDGGATVASGFGDNLDAFLRLQLMHLSLASKRLSQTTERDRAFGQFSLLSVCTSSIISEKSEVRDCGQRFLDPFVTKKIGLDDQFPTALSESDIDAQALAAFCFPNGLRIRLVPRAAEEGAKKLGWLGENGDSYQLQGFTDVAGSLSHGCAITIREEVTHTDSSKFSSVITFHRRRRLSATAIVRWWRKQLEKLRLMNFGQMNSSRSFGSRPRPKAKRANSMVEKWGRKGSAEDSKSLQRQSETGAGLRAAMSKVMSINSSRRERFKTHSMGDLTFDSSDTDDDSLSKGDYACQYPERIRQLGIEAYQAMKDAEEEGDICIVEKSYVLTGTMLKDQSLFFSALQNLINMERKFNDKATKMTKRGSMLNDRNEGANYSLDPENRRTVLSALQSKLSLTPLQRRIAYPRGEMAHINNPQRRFVMDLSIMGFNKISLPLPLPEVSGQWGLCTLFLRIKDSGLIILLKLLLLERSVLVVGETAEEVTACSTALLELMDPYKWASAFMPLLPRDMLDFVSSPVPFIAGMIVEGKQHLHSIIHDHGVKDAMLHGLSIVNLVSGKLIVTREQGTSDMLRRSFQTM
ncbi:hypothetical protein ACHAWF_017925 [Thalassiosira exigua]